MGLQLCSTPPSISLQKSLAFITPVELLWGYSCSGPHMAPLCVLGRWRKLQILFTLGYEELVIQGVSCKNSAGSVPVLMAGQA